MILVFFIVIIIIAVLLIALFSKIKIKVSDVYLDSENTTENNKKMIMQICLNLLGFDLIKIKFNKSKLDKMYAKNKHKLVKYEVVKDTTKEIDYKRVMRIMKKVPIRLSKLDLKITVGTEDCIVTSYLITAISIIISNILPRVAMNNIETKNYKYKVMPVYNKYMYNIKLDCIIYVKLVHIIYVIYLIKKGRSDKNERTSNRKSYDYSYE